MSNLLETLRERGFIESVTHDQLGDFLEKQVHVYCGFDPTSDSLHLGNMVAIMGLAWFQKFGHTPYVILGGATGMIGDPSGKSKERQLLDEKQLSRNVEGIRKNFHGILDFTLAKASPVVLNNYDWFRQFSFVQFLREVGKYFRVSTMLSKESVRTRLESEEGLSFTEFSYQLLQGYDFLYLNENHNVSVQIGGSDQWGNITAGIDLVRRVAGKEVYGLTMPLLTTSDGKKFGKSEEGAIWLSPDKLSPYQFYQYLVRVQDNDVIRLMKMLTFMEMDEIRKYESMMEREDYVPNTAQKRLAAEVTQMVHGDQGLKTALKVTEAAKPGRETDLNAEVLESIANDMPSETFKAEEIVNNKLIDVVVLTGLQESKGQARRLIRNGGCYLNNKKMTEENHVFTADDFVDGRLILLAVGKKNKKLIRLDKPVK